MTTQPNPREQIARGIEREAEKRKHAALARAMRVIASNVRAGLYEEEGR